MTEESPKAILGPEAKPDLQAAATEVEAVIRKHGCAGIVGLVSPHGGELRTAFPAWSLIQVNDHRMTGRTPKDASEAPLAQASLQLLGALAHISAVMADAMGRHFEALRPKNLVQVAGQIPLPGLPAQRRVPPNLRG